MAVILIAEILYIISMLNLYGRIISFFSLMPLIKIWENLTDLKYMLYIFMCNICMFLKMAKNVSFYYDPPFLPYSPSQSFSVVVVFIYWSLYNLTQSEVIFMWRIIRFGFSQNPLLVTCMMYVSHFRHRVCPQGNVKKQVIGMLTPRGSVYTKHILCFPPPPPPKKKVCFTWSLFKMRCPMGLGQKKIQRCPCNVDPVWASLLHTED